MPEHHNLLCLSPTNFTHLQNFTLHNPSIEPTHVLLIDDVITTGATLEALVRVIQENKPELRVSIVSLAITK